MALAFVRDAAFPILRAMDVQAVHKSDPETLKGQSKGCVGPC
jgi:hypothetical protein